MAREWSIAKRQLLAVCSAKPTVALRPIRCGSAGANSESRLPTEAAVRHLISERQECPTSPHSVQPAAVDQSQPFRSPRITSDPTESSLCTDRTGRSARHQSSSRSGITSGSRRRAIPDVHAVEPSAKGLAGLSSVLLRSKLTRLVRLGSLQPSAVLI